LNWITVEVTLILENLSWFRCSYMHLEKASRKVDADSGLSNLMEKENTFPSSKLLTVRNNSKQFIIDLIYLESNTRWRSYVPNFNYYFLHLFRERVRKYQTEDWIHLGLQRLS
jgi:hypothetical protein